MIPRPSMLALGAAFLALAGCANPSFIGVQDYGTVYGNAVTSAGAPITTALVSATGTTQTYQTSSNGAFTISNVAVGEQTVTISAPGYATASATVVVTKDMSVNAGNVVLTLVSSTPVSR